MPTLSFKEKLTSWEVMSTNLKARLDEIPHMSEDQAALEALLAEGRGLEAQQGMYTAALRETNRKRVLLEIRGDELRERMAGSLRGKFGPTSHRLYEFGLKPRIRRRRVSVDLKLRRLEQQKQRLEQKRQALEQQEKLLLEAQPPAGENLPETGE